MPRMVMYISYGVTITMLNVILNRENCGKGALAITQTIGACFVTGENILLTYVYAAELL